MSSGNSDLRRAALLGLACISLASTLCAAGVLVQPASIYLTADAGSNVESEISLSPTSANTTVLVSLAPFTLDEHGQPRSCECRLDRAVSGWGDVDAHRVSLTAGRREVITIRLSVPAAAEGSYWGVVMVEAEQPQRRQDLRLRSRIAVPLFITIRGTEEPRIRLKDLSAFKTAEGIVVSGTVENEGNIILHAPLVIAVETGAASAPVELASLEDAVLIVLPNGRRVFRLTLNGHFDDPSQLRVTAWLRFGSEAKAVAEAMAGVSSTPPCDSPGCAGT